MSKKRKAETDAALDSIKDETPCSATNVPATASTVSLATSKDALTTVPDGTATAGNGSSNASALNAAAPSTETSLAATTNTIPLDKLARLINARLYDAEASDTKAREAGQAANDSRIAAGHLLVQARTRVGVAQWAAWYKKHINRSKADIYRCIGLVEAPDPIKAREAEKTKAREGMAATRAKEPVSNVRDQALAKVQAAKPAPDKRVWDNIGKPASQVRDETTSAAANKLGTLTSYALATEVETQLRLLEDAKWSTVSDVRKQEITRLIHKLLARINPEK